MTMYKAVLELSADVDEDNERETAEFHMLGNVTITDRVSLDHLVKGAGKTASSVLSSRSGDETSKRKGFHLDLGAGANIIEIDFDGWEGATDDAGDPVQWGVRNPSDNADMVDATGGTPLSQMALLKEFLKRGEYDSRAEHAKLRYGEYSGGSNTAGDDYPPGVYDDYLHVVVLRANMPLDVQRPKAFSGSIVLEETMNISKPIDALSKAEWG